MKYLYYPLFALVIFASFPKSAFAARLYVMPQDTRVAIDETLEVEVRADIQTDESNAVDLRVSFSPELLEFDSYMDGGSFVNIWVEKPHVVLSSHCTGASDTCATVVMSGIAPGGFTGDGLVTKLRFTAKNNGRGKLAFQSDSKVFANADDAQTLFIVTNPATFTVVGKEQISSPTPFISPAQDTSPPEIFPVKLARDEIAFDNKWFISFTTKDADSGVDYYEVREKPFGIFSGAWKRAESPYILQNQQLLSVIDVRAVNAHGVVQESVLVPGNLKVLYGTLFGLALITLLVFGFLKITRAFPLTR